MAKIVGKIKDMELGIKRFYLPGIKVVDTCPLCEKEVTWDFEELYLSYPWVNMLEKLPLYCKACDQEWHVPVVLIVNLELVK